MIEGAGEIGHFKADGDYATYENYRQRIAAAGRSDIFQRLELLLSERAAEVDARYSHWREAGGTKGETGIPQAQPTEAPPQEVTTTPVAAKPPPGPPAVLPPQIPAGTHIIKSPEEYSAFLRKYGIPNAIEVEPDPQRRFLKPFREGAAFIDDETGAIVGYAPPELGPKKPPP